MPWLTVQDILTALPDPLRRSEAAAEVTDPNYGFNIPVGELSDHFMDTVLTKEEVEINRKAKTDHSWYGRMAFPDLTNRPARTVMATQTGVSRETLVLEWELGGKKVYRRPTIRECAAFQTFPLTYQFWGRTAETRYKLVGNAVPPVLAAAVARCIANKAGVPVPSSPVLTKRCFEFPPPVRIAHRSSRFNARRFPVDRKFRDHIPGSRTRGFRVDIDNLGITTGVAAAPTRSIKAPNHLRNWTARLYVGSGKQFLCVVPTFEQAMDQLAGCCTTTDHRLRAERLGVDLEGRVVPWLSDATTLQAVWAGKIARRNTGPREILWRLARIVDKHFPPEKYGTVVGPVSSGFPRVDRSEMPIRTAAFLFAASFATEVINRMAPGVTLGQSALEEFALQSGMVLEEGRLEVEIPPAGQMITNAIGSREGAKARRAFQGLDAA